MIDLAAIAAPRLDGAACLGLWSLFDEPERDAPDAREVVASAVRLCRLCPVMAECRTWFESLTPAQRPNGVVAGRLRSHRAPRSRRKAA